MFRLLVEFKPGYHPALPAPAPGPADLTPAIESLALPDEDSDACRAELDHWQNVFPPADFADRTLLEQLTIASIEKQRARRARRALLAEKVRTAAYRFDREEDQKVQEYVNTLDKSPAVAVAGLNESAAGARYLISRWERLKAVFDVEQTWYGQDRDEATRLQSARAGKEHLAESETAYVTCFYCLLAQPEPRPLEKEVAEMGSHELMPQSFRDHDVELWLPAHRHARMLLDELVTHELTALRVREASLRTHIEEPARAAAQEAARVLTGKELALLRNEQAHDALFHRAYQALRRSHRRPSAPSEPTVAASRSERPAARPAVRTGERPKTHCETHTVFFDYDASRRAVLDEDDSQCIDEPEEEAPQPAETPSRPVPAWAEGW
jgi:hypothetical protein